MTGAHPNWKVLSALTTLGLLWPTVGRTEPDWGQSLTARLRLTSIVLDYEIPGHPNEPGRGHAGSIGRASLVWHFDRFLTVEAGVLGRLPFAQDFAEETDAFPILAVTVTPFGPALALRLGTLDIRHGHHPAVVQEERYAYGRPYEELYNRPIQAERDVGQDPFLPVENGASIIAQVDHLKAEVYLDWQLLESEAHREKFAVGVLGRFESRWVDAGFDYRLVHYGGQLFTQRRTGRDPKRQPTTLVAQVRPRPLLIEDLITVELLGAFIHGRVNQTVDAPESTHWGIEAGADVELFELATLGYRVWLPKDGPRFVSEDADPIYSGPRSHRASLGLGGEYGIVELSGRLDLVFADGSDKVWYQTVTTLQVRWEPLIWGDVRYP